MENYRAVSRQDRVWAMGVVSYLLDYGLEDIILTSQYHSYDSSCWENKYRSTFQEKGLSIHHGATKLCIMDEYNPDWVVKLGFEPVAHEQRNNFCQIEANYFSEACARNLERFFAPIYYVGTLSKVKIFIQEKEEVDVDVIESSFRDYYIDHYSSSYYSEWNEMNEEEIICSVLGSSSEVYRLIDFIEENDICDLHSQNWGITKDSNIVLIDYSGYF